MEIELFKRTGHMALGSRLRMLTDMVTADAGRVYELYGVELKPKWFPVFFALMDEQPRPVTEIARLIGQSHPSVINVVREMKRAKLVRERTDRSDKRRTLVMLTEKGSRLIPDMERQYLDVSAAIDRMTVESKYNLWEAIGEWERLFSQQSLLERVQQVKQAREQDDVQIVYFDDALHHDAFRSLNEEWIRDLFGVVEEADHYEFDHPVENIVEKGGYIFIATLHGEPVGTFAMMRCKNPAYDYELVKFAVSPRAQGHGIGSRLIEACLTRARLTGGRRLFLESNRKCAAAVHLYEKYGFRHLKVEHSDYARCDVQMELLM